MAVRPLNSIAGFSTGDPAVTIVQANGDITTINFTANGISNLNSISNVIITGGTNGQFIQTDGTGNLSFTTISTASLSNGTSNVSIPSVNGNVNTSVDGIANVLVVTSSGANITGTLDTTGNITASGLTVSGITDLGNVGNVIITGGSSNQFLRTDGAGNLSFDDIGNLSSNRVAVMPYLIPTGEAYILNDNFQGLYSQPITIDGELTVDGMLIEIQDTTQSNPTEVLFNNTGTATGNTGFTFLKYNGNLNVPGNVNVVGSIIPGADDTYDLGRANARWRNGYFGGNTLYLDTATVKVDANGYVVITNELGGEFIISGNAAAGSNTISDGTSNIVVDFDGNVVTSVNGNANVLTVTTTGANLLGNLTVDGINANSGNISGNIVTANTANIKNALINISLDVENTAAINFKDADGNIAANILLVDDDILINNGNIDLIFGGGAFALSNASNANNALTFALFDDGADILINGNAGNLTFGGGAFVLAASASLDFADGNGNILGNILLADDDILINTGPAGNLVFGGGAFVMTQANSANGSIALLDDDILINTGNGGNLTFGGGAFVADSMVASANVSAGNVKTDHLLYANGTAWEFGQDPGGSNTQVQYNSSGNFAGSANFTFDSATNNLTVTGNVNSTNLNITGNGVVGGNLIVNGNLVYVNVEELSIEDPIINLNTGANGAAPVANSGKDVGSALNYYDTQARVAFMGWDTSNAEFAFGSQTSITSEVVTFTTLGNVRALTFKGNIEATTISGSLTTASQANITTVGTLGSLSVTANISAGNVVGANTISANYLVSNSGCVSVNGAYLAYDSGTGAAGIFSSLATDINFGLAANITAGSTTGTTTVRGNLVVDNNVWANTGTVKGSLLTGTLTTAAQPNITSVGTLTSLSVTGNVSANNATANTITTNSTIGKRANIAVTTDTVIDSFSSSAYRTAKYVIKSENDDGYESLEVLLIHNNINSYVTVYAAINDGGGNTIAITTGINSGNVELRATGLAANTVVNLIGTYVPD